MRGRKVIRVMKYHSCSSRALIVGIRLSDMHCLRIRVRQSRSLDLGSSLLLSKLDLLHLAFPLMLPPNLSTGSVILFSLVFLLSSKLVPYYLSYCGYMLLFHCINSRPFWPSEIELSSYVSMVRTGFRYTAWQLNRFSILIVRYCRLP